MLVIIRVRASHGSNRYIDAMFKCPVTSTFGSIEYAINIGEDAYSLSMVGRQVIPRSSEIEFRSACYRCTSSEIIQVDNDYAVPRHIYALVAD